MHFFYNSSDSCGCLDSCYWRASCESCDCCKWFIVAVATDCLDSSGWFVVKIVFPSKCHILPRLYRENIIECDAVKCIHHKIFSHNSSILLHYINLPKPNIRFDVSWVWAKHSQGIRFLVLNIYGDVMNVSPLLIHADNVMSFNHIFNSIAFINIM